MTVQPIYDHVLVEVEAEWKKEVAGKNGIIGINFENEIERGPGAIRKGVVVAIPRGLSDHHALVGIQDNLEVGDTVYFHFNSIDEESRMEIDVLERPNYLVHLGSVFCFVRHNQIKMYGGRVLAEALYDDDVVDEGGIKVKKTKSGIIAEINVTHNVKKARLAHIGNPLAHQPVLDVAPGEVIYYAKDADFENEIEGQKYFVFYQEDILMKEL